MKYRISVNLTFDIDLHTKIAAEGVASTMVGILVDQLSFAQYKRGLQQFVLDSMENESIGVQSVEVIEDV